MAQTGISAGQARQSHEEAWEYRVPARTRSGERRTVTITGRGAERHLPPPRSRQRPQRPRHERPGFRPDRAAMWAVLLGVLLLLVAATSSHAATLHSHQASKSAATALQPRVSSQHAVSATRLRLG
jgi:hypothetical protein